MNADVTVLKVGGNEVDEPAWVARFARAVAARGGRLVVVHGGGKEVTALQRLLGAEPEWQGGLRVTSDEAMRAVSMVLSASAQAASGRGDGGGTGGELGEDGGLLRARLALAGLWVARGRSPRCARTAPLFLCHGVVPWSPPARAGGRRGAHVNASTQQRCGAALGGGLLSSPLAACWTKYVLES